MVALRTSLLCLAALGACHAARRAALSEDEAKAFYRRVQAERAQQYAALNESARAQLYAGDADITWTDAPGAWHQQTARIVDHRFKTFDAMFEFVMRAKKAGVGAVMLAQIQNTTGCPGPWYNGLQLCDHINGSYPVVDGTLEQWQDMLQKIKPMRLMWWNNPVWCLRLLRPCIPPIARYPAGPALTRRARSRPSRQVYWSVQGGVWAEAKRNTESSVGKWFSWGPESCAGIPQCDGSNVVVPGVGCAQGSWGSKGSNPKTEGVQSALASVGSKAYADYMVDAMTHTWTGNLGIDGYTEDCSCNYGCMLQLTDPEKGSLPDWAKIVKRVRATHPQLVMSGEGYGSWAEMAIADANLGGQGSNAYHIAFQKAVTGGDASQLEQLASTSGSDAASVLCYLNPTYDGLQPGGCPTMYFRDKTRTMTDLKQYKLWVALEAGSGIVSQHDYDPSSTCQGFTGCDFWSSGPCKEGQSGKCGAWWNVTSDPAPAGGGESPLTAFQKYRALNRLALRTKLNVSYAATATTAATTDGAAADTDTDANTETTAGGYTKYPSTNCYNGAGGVEMDKGASIVAPTTADCTAHCDNSTACDCVTYCPEKIAGTGCFAEGACWRRTLCDQTKFERDAFTKPFSVYVKKDWVPPPPPPAPPNNAKGALAYLKHDALGPKGDAAIMVFNPGAAQSVTVDLSALPSHLLSGDTVPHDLFDQAASGSAAGQPAAIGGGAGAGGAGGVVRALARSWTVSMGVGEAKAFGGFSLASFAPRVGKKASCSSSYTKPAPQSTTLEACFLACLGDEKCKNVFVGYVDIIWMEKPPAVSCTLLGGVAKPSTDCKPGTGTLIKKLQGGRPSSSAAAL
jgi:hypothetical protein